MQAVQASQDVPVPVTLHVEAQPFKTEEFEGTRVVGEVRRGSEVLHSEARIVIDSAEVVDSVKERVGISIETWAVKKTDYMPD